MTIRGVEGMLRHGYHVAGTLGAWTVTKTEHGWTLTASVLTSDAFRVSQRPLAFVAKHQTGLWCWPITTLQMTGASLSAELGPMES